MVYGDKNTLTLSLTFTLQYVSQPRTVDDVAKKSQELTRRGSELFGSMPVAHLTALMESEKEKGSGTEEEEEEDKEEEKVILKNSSFCLINKFPKWH